jgi:hypothetical protein
MKTFNEFLNEKNNGTESYKNMIINAFPEYKNPEFLGKGFFGEAYIVEKDNELYVAKITNSLPEYWFSQIVKEYPHKYINKVYDTKVVDKDKYIFLIIRAYRDLIEYIPDNIYKLVDKAKNTPSDTEKYRETLKDKTSIFEFDELLKRVKVLEDYYGFNIDTSQGNWGEDEDGKMVLIDIDGDVPNIDKLRSNMKKRHISL